MAPERMLIVFAILMSLILSWAVLVRFYKGWLGEKKTAFILWLSLNKRTYTRFHNVILTTLDGTTQIDHILVSVFGVFIVETKHMSGWIFGGENDGNWTQRIFKYKNSFQNPLKQTYRQRRVLSEFLSVNEKSIYPVVFFNGRSCFRMKLPSNVLDCRLGKYIKGFRNQIFTENEVALMVHKIAQHKATSTLTNTDHVRSLKERHASVADCPRCGGKLVVRIAKAGANSGQKFFGCKNYPRCRYTTDL